MTITIPLWLSMPVAIIVLFVVVSLLYAWLTIFRPLQTYNNHRNDND